MAPLFRLLTLCLLLNLSLPAAIAGQVSKDDLDAQKELLQLKIDSGKESAQKDVEALGKRIEAVDKRVDDQVNRLSDLSLFSGSLGTLVTTILSILGMLGYFSVASRSKEIAEVTASKTAKKWFNDHQTNLEAQIAQIQNTSQQAKAEIETLQQAAQSYHQEMANLHKKMQDAESELAELQGRIKEGGNDVEKIINDTATLQNAINNQWKAWYAPSAEQLAVEEAAKLKLARLGDLLKEEADRKDDFAYWSSLAFSAYAKNDLKTAAEYWLRTAAIETTPPALAAQALTNAGIVQMRSNQLEEAIKTFEQVIDRYNNDPDPTVRQLVASAMVNKAGTLGKLGHHEEAVKIYEQVIIRHSDNTCSELVVGAMSGKAFGLLLSAKSQLAANPASLVQAVLSEAQVLLQQARDRKPAWGTALGNLAYVQWLLQDHASAETSFRQALRADVHGGETLYRETLDDIAQHPIPADQGFRELVDRLWAEYQSQVPGQATG